MITALLLSLSTAAPNPVEPHEEPTRIPVLIVTGANNHDWQWTSRSLEAILDESGRFEVDVTTEPGKTLADADALKRYAAFVLDYNGPRWGEPAESNFLVAVRGGTGVAVIHAANNAFTGWVPYEELVALCWRQGTGHGRFHAFDVKVVERDHPITRTLPDLKAHPDELYHRLVHMYDTPYHTLASAYSDPETGGTGNDEPMIVVKQFGEGRVFHTPLGHVWKGVEPSHASHADPQFRDLVVRGTEWAATGDVTDGTTRVDPSAWQPLFGSLERCETVGDAVWELDAGEVLGRSGGGAQSFLVTGQTFGDFVLEVDVKLEDEGNSGIQIRSAVADGVMRGYQIEIDPSERSWSGGLYDEGRDGWIQSLEENEPGRAAFDREGWNRYRIECVGPRIRVWLNGVPTVDWDEATDRAGRIALQVHGGDNTRLRWKGARIAVVGER